MAVPVCRKPFCQRAGSANYQTPSEFFEAWHRVIAEWQYPKRNVPV